MTDQHVTLFFGKKWDAPRLDDTEDRRVVQKAVPVGEQCLYCEELILHGDRGLFHPSVTATYRGLIGFLLDWAGWTTLLKRRQRIWTARLRPIHAECDMRMVLGSINHLNGNCICCKGSGFQETEWAGTRRQEALAVWALMNERRQHQGLGPL